MNAAFAPHFPMLGIIVACLLVPPLIGGLVAGVVRIFDAKKQGLDAPPLLQPFQDYYALWRNEPAATLRDPLFFVLLSMAFHLMALVMLGLQKNLSPVLFLQAFGVLVLIMGGMSRPVPYYGLSANHALKAFLISQPLVFLVAAGVFFATGSFDVSAVNEYPRLLVFDLPLLCMALLLVEKETRSDENESAANGRALLAVKLANCYRAGTFLLLAGFFFAHSLAGAVWAAIILNILLAVSSRISLRKARELKAAWGWGYVFFACGVNLTWIYIKYWI